MFKWYSLYLSMTHADMAMMKSTGMMSWLQRE
jgi:hypothetical protein